MRDPKVAKRFGEWLRLDRRRKGDGLRLGDYERWFELKQRLNKTFAPEVANDRLAMRESVTVPLRLKVSFETTGELRGSLMPNLSRGGMFLNTAHTPPLGTHLVPGIRFLEASPEATRVLNRLYEGALDLSAKPGHD